MPYLDHAATTPVLPAVAAVVAETMTAVGNPSSVHSAGRRARRVVEEARESIAARLGAHPTEVLFTSGGTESDNLGVAGTFEARQADDPRRRRIVVSPTEHPAVIETVESLERSAGAELVWLDVDVGGAVDPVAAAAALADDADSVALVAAMWANNETGAVTDIPAVGAIARTAGVPLHTDAVQAIGAIDVDFARSGASTLALAGHKLGGPSGIGILLASRSAALAPITFGGGQERGLRSGSLNVAGIAGLAVAVEQAVTDRAAVAADHARLTQRLIAGVQAAVPWAVVTRSDGPHLPGIAHLRFPDCESETMLMLLDSAGIDSSAGSACTAGVTRASHVLLGIGLSEREASSGLRFSLGHTSSDADIDAVLAVIGEVADRALAAFAARASAPHAQRAVSA